MTIWELNLRHLRALVEIADRGTMIAAAVAVNLTQPAITQALARIEASLGVALFERRHDGMSLTPAAELLIPRIRAALGRIDSAWVTMARMRALIAVADAGSYSAAAYHTGLSPPSLHRAVTDLSLSLRLRLVERRGASILMTTAGLQLARTFRLACVELEAGLAEIEALKGNETRRVAVGAMPLSRARVLPAAVTRFMRSHPQVRISILEGSRAELVEPLRNGAIDLMVGALREPLPEPDLEQRPLFNDVPVIVGRRGHPLDGAAPGLDELGRYPWVVPAPGAPLRTSWERMYSEAGLPLPAAPVESGSVMIIRQLLIGSDLLTYLSPDQVAVELDAGWLSVIAQAPPGGGRVIGVTSRLGWRPTAVQSDFLRAVEAESAQAGAGDLRQSL